MAEATLTGGTYKIEQPDPYLHIKCKWPDKSWLLWHGHIDGYGDLAYCVMFKFGWLHQNTHRQGFNGIWTQSRFAANTRIIEFYDNKKYGPKKPGLVLYLYMDGTCKLEVK